MPSLSGHGHGHGRHGHGHGHGRPPWPKKGLSHLGRGPSKKGDPPKKGTLLEGALRFFLFLCFLLHAIQDLIHDEKCIFQTTNAFLYRKKTLLRIFFLSQMATQGSVLHPSSARWTLSVQMGRSRDRKHLRRVLQAAVQWQGGARHKSEARITKTTSICHDPETACTVQANSCANDG